MSFLESLAETQELVSLPTVATKVLSLLEKDNADVREISKLVESDASMSLKILRLANSPMFALRTEVASINQAILTVGLNRVTNIVLGVSIFSKFIYLSRSSAAKYVDSFWKHSAATASVAKTLAVRLKKNFQDAEFLGGLIHDIGKLAMLQHDANKFVEMMTLIENGTHDDLAAEAQVYGATHTQAGEVIVRLWKMPQTLQSIVCYHDNPGAAGDAKAVTSLIRVADLLCEKWGAGIGENVADIDIKNDTAWKNLCSLYPDVAAMDFDALAAELETEFSQASSALQAMLAD
ncbi:MAG: HDOD domain-containing protein [Candidatus Kapabacteria bacterium]|nr:HDOD domain-containing protein [Candidatus Kapabacteria bacterium]